MRFSLSLNVSRKLHYALGTNSSLPPGASDPSQWSWSFLWISFGTMVSPAHNVLAPQAASPYPPLCISSSCLMLFIALIHTLKHGIDSFTRSRFTPQPELSSSWEQTLPYAESRIFNSTCYNVSPQESHVK